MNMADSSPATLTPAGTSPWGTPRPSWAPWSGAGSRVGFYSLFLLIFDVYLPEDTGEDSEVCHRQALHFLAKAEYPAALALVERARMAYLDNRQEIRVMLENYLERTIYSLHQGDRGPGHELYQHRQHPGRVPPQARGLCHVQKVCRAGLHQNMK